MRAQQCNNMVDKEHVLEGCPWSFHNQILLLQEVRSDQQPCKVTFKHSPFRARILDVVWFSRRSGHMSWEIGEALGRLIEFDKTDPLGWEEFMRVKVMIDLQKPLRRG